MHMRMAKAVSRSFQAPSNRQLFAPDPDAARRFIEFFTADLRNLNTRRRKLAELPELRHIEAVRVWAYSDALQRCHGGSQKINLTIFVTPCHAASQLTIPHHFSVEESVGPTNKSLGLGELLFP